MALLFVLTFFAFVMGYMLCNGVALVVKAVRGERYPMATWNGPLPTEQQRIAARQWMVDFLEKYPESPIGNQYPQELHQALTVAAYKKIEYLHQEGVFDVIDYHRNMDALLDQVDITEINQLCQTNIHPAVTTPPRPMKEFFVRIATRVLRPWRWVRRKVRRTPGKTKN